MTTDKKVTTATKVVYWIPTVLTALSAMSGVFFINSQMTKDGMAHLGLPYWLMMESTIGSFIGGLILLLPVWKRLKEWAYTAFGITYISALVAHLTIDGFGSEAIQAVIFFGILLLSYIYYHKIND